MRMAWFLSLTYIAGIDGFGFFVPYLFGVGVIALVCRRLPRQTRAGAAETISAGALLELEAAAA